MIKSYTDLEQSKKLAEILPIESADMYYEKGIGDNYRIDFGNYADMSISKNLLHIDAIPCWSLSALIGVLPKQFGRYTKSLGWFDDAWHCVYMDEDSECKYCVSADNPIDACVAMIIKLSELKML